ncbi:putative interactor of constitutive active ROPs 1 [Cocos nucifera]|uniref:Putative interactor of constitutive active ROPs 1 n=1 Tax=Cocos nucifera TaxID=13894 RepID=A0A8K0IW23_COCNU|nr:putative interactor of constitutive active ROPs 1 [Cocos nucifera]
MSQRQSPRTPLHLKATACSEANGVHRHSVDRSPKLEDGRSPRSTHHEKKRGTRVADLETKFRRAQEELKKLREQLASTESAKKEAQEALEEAKKRIPAVATTPQNLDEEKPPLPSKEETETAGPCLDSLEKSEQKVERELPEPGSEGESINPTAADVFEGVWPAPVPAETIKTDNEVGNYNEKEGKEKEEEEAKAMDEKKDGETEMTATEKTELEEEENKPTELAESPEVLELKAKLLDKEKELENLLAENERLKKKAEEVSENAMAAARAQEEKLGSVEEELKESQAKVERLGEQLETLEETRAALEAEMKRLRELRRERRRRRRRRRIGAMAEEQQLRLDLEELRHLESIAKRPRVHSLLSSEIRNLDARLSQVTAAVAAAAQPAASAEKAPAAASDLNYVTVGSFSWDQDNDKIKDGMLYVPAIGMMDVQFALIHFSTHSISICEMVPILAPEWCDAPPSHWHLKPRFDT